MEKYIGKLEFKRESLREIFRNKAKEEKMEIIEAEINNTLDYMDRVFNYKKHDADHRMKGMYTYDIKENPDYRESQKTEEKVRSLF